MDKRFTAVSDCANCAERYMRSHLHPFMRWIQKSWCDSRWKTAWWFLGWPRPITIQKLQVRLHSNLDGSSLAHAIQVPMGPLRDLEVLHLFRWFTHTHFYALHAGFFTYRRFYFYTQTPLHTDAFTQRHFYTQTPLPTATFTQLFLHTDAFADRRFCTQTLLHTDAFAHRGTFYTQTLVHKCLFHTNTLDTQTLWHNKACTKYFPALLHTTQLADGARGGKRGARGGREEGARGGYERRPVPVLLLLQSSHEVLPSTTSYHKACRTYFPVLLTLYYKAWTKHYPVLLCTLAQSTLPYKVCTKYFVLQSLHNVLPSVTSYYLHRVLPSTLYYKACT